MTLGDIKIELVQKGIKNLHLSVHPPYGNVRIAAPLHLSKETIRLYAISKLSWIKKQQQKIRNQARESSRQFINKETHYFQGRKYLLKVFVEDKPPRVVLQKNHIELYIRPKATLEQRQAIMNDWYRTQLRQTIPELIKKWEVPTHVKVRGLWDKENENEMGYLQHRSPKNLAES